MEKVKDRNTKTRISRGREAESVRFNGELLISHFGGNSASHLRLWLFFLLEQQSPIACRQSALSSTTLHLSDRLCATFYQLLLLLLLLLLLIISRHNSFYIIHSSFIHDSRQKFAQFCDSLKHLCRNFLLFWLWPKTFYHLPTCFITFPSPLLFSTLFVDNVN